MSKNADTSCIEYLQLYAVCFHYYSIAECRKWWGAGVVICLERDADLYMAQLMPPPLTVSCFSKIQIVFTFLVLAYPGSPGQMGVKQVCVCAEYHEWEMVSMLVEHIMLFHSMGTGIVQLACWAAYNL